MDYFVILLQSILLQRTTLSRIFVPVRIHQSEIRVSFLLFFFFSQKTIITCMVSID